MNTNYIHLLPKDMIKETLYELSVKDIMSICSADKTIQSICKDDQFWKEYVTLKHGMKNPWQQLAKLAENEKVITIYNNGRIIKLTIYADMSLKELLDQVNLLVPDNDMYELQLIHPFHSMDRIFIQYRNNEILYFADYRRYVNYFDQDKPIGNSLLYDMLWQIDVSS